ncbi:hypothetical protein A9Q83_15040 [Alphaproteobacteria bacterium 46_93_T64]|nr:hypothetical protein A9Q83_15040 [Alphaproteobacteria bacterium 46_93_T64]
MYRILIACISYIVLTFVIAMTWNMVLFRDIYISLAASSLRPEPIVPLGLLTVVIEAVALSLLFHTFYRSAPSFKNALLLALSVGTFNMTYAAFTVPAKFLISPVWQYASLELAFGIVHYGLAGIAFFFIFGKRVTQDVRAIDGATS